MPKENSEKSVSIDTLRHSEYYNMQKVLDELYAKSKNGETFDNLMDVIQSRENILMAYRNLKTNSGSKTPGTDGLTIFDIGKLPSEEVVEQVRSILKGSKEWGYRPRPVRRKEIPKPNGDTRPLGIPCIWDRLIQQCIKQVLEPICEAKFSDNSYGFRPNRSVENAIARTYQLMQVVGLHYVVEFDIKGFFDNVNHSKLMKQMWTIGIRDKSLLWIIKRILKAPIKMPDGAMVYPIKGTPQGGIISPLLANIVLNELDQWIDGQWQENPVTRKYSIMTNANGSENKGSGYRAMRGTNLKEMYIVRYADDFRIFCRTKEDAQKILIAVTQWLKERLRLEVSEEKTRVVNTEQKYLEFLGFKIKVHKKGNKSTVESHISDKALAKVRQELVEQAKSIAKSHDSKDLYGKIKTYNSMVMGIQNYYCIATHISKDLHEVNRAVMTILTNRLQKQSGGNLERKGRKLTETENARYGRSKQTRYYAGIDEPIYPIGYIQHKKPINRKYESCFYTEKGRKCIHDNLKVNVSLMLQMMRQPLYERSVEYADNRISLFSAQRGKCAITGKEFQCLEDIHCHHKIPRAKAGKDNYDNLVLVLDPVHKLIHATEEETIKLYLKNLRLTTEQIRRLNEFRELVGNSEIKSAKT